MTKSFFEKMSTWWQENVLSLPENDNAPKAKVAKVKVKTKRADKNSPSEKEIKSTIKTLNGPFGRMDRHYDDIQ